MPPEEFHCPSDRQDRLVCYQHSVTRLTPAFWQVPTVVCNGTCVINRTYEESDNSGIPTYMMMIMTITTVVMMTIALRWT